MKPAAAHSPDYMHLAPQFSWDHKDVHVVIFADEFFCSLEDSKRGGFGIAFFNQRVGFYSHGRLDASDKESLVDYMDQCCFHSTNYRPYREWDEEHLEEHRGLNDAPPPPNVFPMRVVRVKA